MRTFFPLYVSGAITTDASSNHCHAPPHCAAALPLRMFAAKHISFNITLARSCSMRFDGLSAMKKISLS